MSSIEDYCTRHTSTLGGTLNDIYRSVALHTANPHMASSPIQGTFLHMMAAILRPEVAVEIGAHAGFGSACIATGMGGHGILHLVEANPEYQTLISRHAEMAGISDLIRLHIGQAKDILPSLPNGIGLAYIDADKENYDNYYSMLLPKMKKGGVLLLDNMLWYGRVVDEEKNTAPSTSELRCQREARLLHQLNNRITLDERVDNILLPLRDGIMLCLVR